MVGMLCASESAYMWVLSFIKVQFEEEGQKNVAIILESFIVASLVVFSLEDISKCSHWVKVCIHCKIFDLSEYSRN